MPIYFGEYANILFPKMSQQGDVGYQQWLSKYGIRESDDYDTYAAYQSGLKPGENGHLGDEFKLPNHITYSKQSLSSKKDGAPPAGEWQDLGENKWAFKATETNVKNAGGIKRLKDYWDRVEPGNTLILPGGEKYVGTPQEDE